MDQRTHKKEAEKIVKNVHEYWSQFEVLDKQVFEKGVDIIIKQVSKQTGESLERVEQYKDKVLDESFKEFEKIPNKERTARDVLGIYFKFMYNIGASKCPHYVVARIERLFEKAAKKHKGRFESLMAYRGIEIEKEFVTLANVQDKLKRYKEHTTLLFYDQDDTYLKIWALNPSEVRLREIQLAKKELVERLYGFRKNINTLGAQNERAATPKRGFSFGRKVKQITLKQISMLLVPSDLHDMMRLGSNLLIVPSLNIASVPFAVLQFPQYNDKTTNSLVDSFNITVLPSLFDTDNVDNNFFYINSSRVDSIKNSLIVGNPKYYDDPDWRFPNLPGAEEEAIKIAQYLKTSPILGQEATKSHIVDKMKESDVIYFATHGISSPDSPLEDSFIALSGSTIENSRLTAKDIQRLYLQARLVVLSACQTGLGRAHEAGIIGLARAFKIAGANDVVVSLWNVDDHVTAELMGSFMGYYLEKELNASQALRKAMIKTRDTHSDPRLWSSFIVVSGKGTVIEG